MYKLLEFNEDNFAESLKNDATPPSLIRAKNQFGYLFGYLSRVGTRTIIVEEEYISNDYLQDYAYYYSTCFVKYKKYCRRLHFFSYKFDQVAFERLITHGSIEFSFKETYVGFIVVKPIPHSVIGFTALKTYDSTIGSSLVERDFWGTRQYHANLFGIPLTVKSLAFQEQDAVVSACATTAIWSMLHGAMRNADHTIVLKSQAEITADGGHDSDGNRIFPNHGLELPQISDSIAETGLQCEIKTIRDATSWLLEDYDEDLVQQGDDGLISQEETQSCEQSSYIQNDRIPTEYLKKILNAYSSIRIPLILIISTEDDEHETHAITVSGFLKEKPNVIQAKNPMSFSSNEIIKFYAHDDQWGPFVKISFEKDNLLNTTWTEADGSQVYVSAIVISLYPQIRISYVDIEPLVRAYDRILSMFLNEYIKEDLIWDIRLKLNVDYREQLKNEMNPPSDYPEKLGVLLTNLPKYIWNASCLIGGKKFLDFAFDATGISQAMLGLHLISHFDKPLTDHIVANLEANRNEKAFRLFRHDSGELYFDFLLNELKR